MLAKFDSTLFVTSEAVSVLGAGSGIHGVLDRKGQRDPFILFLIKLTKLFRRHGGGYGELTLFDKPNVGDGGCGVAVAARVFICSETIANVAFPLA